MKKINYELFNEKLYTMQLENGLTVNLMPRMKFHQTFGILTAHFGSIDRQFMLSNGKIKTYPAGIAHFLEHKLFEKKDHDAFDEFALYGADSNAFTSFTRTSYLFSTSRNVEQCVTTLLDFVQHPYFSERTVEKEKGIIGQEIKMYEDDSNWQLLFGIIKNLYSNTALTADIAGNVSSIQKITPQMLYECYDHFYQPDNISLVLVGNFDLEQMKDLIVENQKAIKNDRQNSVKQILFNDGQPSVIASGQRQMNIQRPKLGIAIRGVQNFTPFERLKYKLAMQIMLELLFGESSLDYQRLYNEGIIDNTFDYEIQLEEQFYFVYFSMDTVQLEKANAELRKIFANAHQKLEQQSSIFEIMKKEFIGRYIKGMNSNENIANQFDQWLFGEKTIFDIPQLIDNLQMSDLIRLADDFFQPDQITEYKIYPKEKVL